MQVPFGIGTEPVKNYCAVRLANRVNVVHSGRLVVIMGITEKAAYLQGLIKGLDIDESTKEGKLLVALVDVVGEMADSIADLEDVCDELDEVVDILDEDLGNLEQDFYSFDEDDMDDDDCGCGCGCEDDDDDEDIFEVTCPSCNDTVYLDEGMVEEGSMNCPNCGELLEFDYNEDSEDKE